MSQKVCMGTRRNIFRKSTNLYD